MCVCARARVCVRVASDGMMLAAVGPALSALEWKVSEDVAASAPIWLDEFNWGGDWAGVTWPGEGHGALRGLLWATYVLRAHECIRTDVRLS